MHKRYEIMHIYHRCVKALSWETKKSNTSRIGYDLLCGAVSAAGSYKSVKELLHISNADSNVINAASDVINATAE